MTPETFGQLVVGHLQGWLRALQAADASEARRSSEIAAQGFRLVDGGQVSGWSEGKTRVEYTDAETGEVLFEGDVSRPEEGWDEAWYHVDRLQDDLELPDNPVDPTLLLAVQGFLEAISATALDLEPAGLRALLGEITR